ncbi:MAG TPA: phospholipase D family protein [Bradyrhizobium sp.]|nr:phospholipase D family protein [Bradyrhizobium sp.]
MNRILTTEIWQEAKKLARTASSRKLAVAYVTADHVALRRGDVLVTDASPRSIRSGQTDAKLLAKLHKAGVVIHSREGLHSKVMLIGKYAVVGSANMSGSGLTEAAVLSDEPTIRSGVASFIAQLCTKKSRLDGPAIAALCKIEVIRSGWPKAKPKKPIRIRRLGNATWIVGVYDLSAIPPKTNRSASTAPPRRSTKG